MGLFDKISKKKNEEEEEEVVVAAKTPEEMKREQKAKSSSFVMGVEKILPDEGGATVLLLGKMDGAAVVDSKAFISNPGSDVKEETEVTILGIQEEDGE